MKKNWVIAAGLAAAISATVGAGAVLGGSVAGSSGLDDEETAITGAALERASSAALAFTGGGRVTETEVGDEDSLYEVEVTLDDGSRVDVQLDETFGVVGSKVDRDDDD